jgi:hypothetical protein
MRCQLHNQAPIAAASPDVVVVAVLTHNLPWRFTRDASVYGTPAICTPAQGRAQPASPPVPSSFAWSGWWRLGGGRIALAPLPCSERDGLHFAASDTMSNAPLQGLSALPRAELMWTVHKHPSLYTCELRDYGPRGVEARVIKDRVVLVSQQFDTRAFAVQWANEARLSLLNSPSR